MLTRKKMEERIERQANLIQQLREEKRELKEIALTSNRTIKKLEQDIEGYKSIIQAQREIALGKEGIKNDKQKKKYMD